MHRQTSALSATGPLLKHCTIVAPSSQSSQSTISVRAVKPTKLTIIKPPTPVVAGEMISLTCTVDGARPRSSISWFNRSQPVQQTPVENTELMEDGTYRTSSTLVFIATRFDHQSEFFCKGTNDVLKSKNEVPLLQATQLQVLCK